MGYSPDDIYDSDIFDSDEEDKDSEEEELKQKENNAFGFSFAYTSEAGKTFGKRFRPFLIH